MNDRRNSTKITYTYERWRAISAGILETAGVTFLLLITVRNFQAGATARALVAAAGSVGLLITPWVVSRVEASRWNTSHAASLLVAIGAGSFLIAALLPFLPLFIICSIVGMATTSAIVPLLTQMYQENYPDTERGKLFSHSVMIRVATAALFSQLAGNVLTRHMDRFPWLLLVFAGALAFSSFCLSRCPTHPLSLSESTHPFRALKHIQKDPLFRRTLVCWMLMGFANLMMLPMRVEYLANPKYGLTLNTATIALFTGVIPNLARLIMSPIWGRLFDRWNFFVLRIILNLGFALAILTFFTGHSMVDLFLGSLIFGISNAGGDVAWSLWVIEFAPPNRVADYMSVHTFLTGVRGVLAPMAAFHLVARLSMGALGLLSAGLIVAASLMMVREIKFGRQARKKPALVEEISE